MWIVARTELGTGKVIEIFFKTNDKAKAEMFCRKETDFLAYVPNADIDLPENIIDWPNGYFPRCSEVDIKEE